MKKKCACQTGSAVLPSCRGGLEWADQRMERFQSGRLRTCSVNMDTNSAAPAFMELCNYKLFGFYSALIPPVHNLRWIDLFQI